MATVILPVSVNLFGIRMSPIRLYLLISFIPALVYVFSSRAGRVIAADILMAVFAVWMVVTYVVNDGIERLPYATISAIEVLGSYLLGRCLIRNALDYRFLLKLHLLALLFLLPFSLVEHLTTHQPWTRFLDHFGDVTYRVESSRPRFGLQRVLNGFEHPILFGIFCSMAVASVFYAWRQSTAAALGRLGFAIGMTFMSLSSGAFLSAILQLAMIVWDKLTRGNWKLLVGLFVFTYLFLSVASNRGPVVIFIETLAFDKGTAWTRIVQWEYGTAEVLRNPIFGKGLRLEWARPEWLYTSSIDNYWLVIAFRHGLPGIALLLAAFGAVLWVILRARRLPEEIDWIRTGHVITLIGVCFSLATVHVWDAIAVYIYFFLGAGIWISQISDASAQGIGEMPNDKSNRKRPGYLRPSGSVGVPRFSRFSPRMPEHNRPAPPSPRDPSSQSCRHLGGAHRSTPKSRGGGGK